MCVWYDLCVHGSEVASDCAAAVPSQYPPLQPNLMCGPLLHVYAMLLNCTGLKESVIVLLRSASGDEEVGAAGANLKGVVLTQDLPHLSHLGKWGYTC